MILEVVFSPREDIPLVRGLKIFLLLEVLTQKLGKKYFAQNIERNTHTSMKLNPFLASWSEIDYAEQLVITHWFILQS